MADPALTESETGSLLETLRRISMFARLGEADLDSLARSGRPVQFEPGQTLMTEGEPGDQAFVLLAGRVSVTRGGTEVVQRGPGDCVGELALLDSSPRSATVLALDPVRAVALHRDQFGDLLAAPAFVKSLLLALSAKVREGDVEIRSAWEHLRRLSTLKDDLFHLILHDLRNPLGNLLAAVSFLKQKHEKEAPDERLKRLLQAANISGQYMQRLLDEVLEVCRLEGSEFKVEMEQVDLRILAQEAVLNFVEVAALRRVSIEAEEGPACSTFADPKLVRRTVENFISNALRYTPQGTTVRVSIDQTPDWTTINVADQGPGVPAEYRETVFRKFGTVEEKSHVSRRGYGLGLHLATLVASSHGGAVAVDDNPGGGAVFRLRLPTRPPAP